jgi:hypothetical protein
VKFGIQRRNIYVCPLVGMDRFWISQQLLVPEIVEMFGYGDDLLAGARIEYGTGRLLLATIRRVEDRKRIGFVSVHAPCAEHDFWDFSFAIPQEKNRDLFSSIHAMDAVLHYMFDHVGVPLMGGTTRLDNKPALAVVRRIGYQVVGTRQWHGPRYAIIQLDAAGWKQRVAKLQKGEDAHPSPGRQVFTLLRGPPYNPVSNHGPG